MLSNANASLRLVMASAFGIATTSLHNRETRLLSCRRLRCKASHQGPPPPRASQRCMCLHRCERERRHRHVYRW
eukprot:5175192-Pleurochrysis_carterae.AAC.6